LVLSPFKYIFAHNYKPGYFVIVGARKINEKLFILEKEKPIQTCQTCKRLPSKIEKVLHVHFQIIFWGKHFGSQGVSNK